MRAEVMEGLPATRLCQQPANSFPGSLLGAPVLEILLAAKASSSFVAGDISFVGVAGLGP